MNRMNAKERPGDAALGAKARPADSARSEVIERERRLAELRCATRVLAPVLGSHEREELARVARLVDERLVTLAEPRPVGGVPSRERQKAQGGSPEIRGDLVWLDAKLRGHAEILCAALDRAPLPQRRSLLIQIERTSRTASMTLLDLLIEDEARLAERLAILVVLVALLATEEKGGARRVVRDPAALTARLRSVAERSGAEASIDLERAEQSLLELAQRGARDGVEAIAEDLDARKAELGVALLAPSVLRAVVFCESMAWRSASEAGGDRRTPAPALETARSASAEPALRSRRDASASPRRDASLQQASAPSAPAKASASTFRWSTAPATSAETASARRPETSVSQPATRTRRIAGLLGAAASVGMAAHLWWVPERGAVRVFSDRELAALSPEIASGYRSGSGAGPLFVGTVGPDWAERSPEERGEAARKVISRLAGSGVSEVLLLDDARRVAVHHADGIPLRIGPEAEAAG